MKNRAEKATWMVLAFAAAIFGRSESANADWVVGAALSHCKPMYDYSADEFFINGTGANNISQYAREVLCGFGVPGDVATELYVDYRDKHNSQTIECTATVMGWDGYTIYWSGYQYSAPGHQTGYFHYQIPANARGYGYVRCKIPPTEGGWRSSIAGINYGF